MLNIGSQRAANRGKRKKSVFRFMEHADRRKGAQQPVERLRMGIGQRGKFAAGAFSVLEMVCDAQRGGDAYRLRYLEPIDHFLEFGSSCPLVHEALPPAAERARPATEKTS